IALVGKNQIVHFPELTLPLRSQSRSVRERRVGMKAKRKTLEYPADLLRILRHQVAQGRCDFGAERALQIREFNDRHRRLRIPAHWRARKIELVNRYCAGACSEARTSWA